jgi:hypothetical protein
MKTTVLFADFACPFCGSHGHCPHWIGWTEDGKTVEPRAMILGQHATMAALGSVLETDRIVKTGTTARVYRR